MRFQPPPGVPRGAGLTSNGRALAAVIQAAVFDAMICLRLMGFRSANMLCLAVLAVEDVEVYIK
jgi:hypothetical protein